MTNFPPNSASRRPESSWPPPEDEDFRIVPPAGVSAPPPGVSSPPPMAAPPPPPVQPRVVAPPPPPVVVTPRPATRPATTTSPNRQRLDIGLGAGAILLAAIAFFIYFELVLNPSTTVTPTPGVSQFAVVATAAATKNWPTAVPGCAALNSNSGGPTPSAADAKVLAATFYNCGLHLVEPAQIADHPQVDLARQYFQKSDQLAPSNDAKHQVELATRYLDALTTAISSQGGYIDQLSWFFDQPEFGNTPYADTAPRLYAALIDSGDGYVQGGRCALAEGRYTKAFSLKNFVDTTAARQKLESLRDTCK